MRDAHRAAGFGGEPRGGRPRLREVPQRRIVDWRVAKFRQIAHGAGVEINYRSHSGHGAKTIQPVNLIWRPAEAGAIQEVARAFV